MNDVLRKQLRQELLGIVHILDDETMNEEDELETVGLLCGCFLTMVRSTNGSEENALELVRRAWPDENSQRRKIDCS